MAGTHECHRRGQFLVIHLQRTAQRLQVALGEQIEMIGNDATGQWQRRGRRVEPGELQREAFGEIARTDTDGLEQLHE